MVSYPFQALGNSFKKFKDGMFQIVSSLRLNVVDAIEEGITSQDVQKDKELGIAQSENKNPYSFIDVGRAINEHIQMRTKATTHTIGTIYGMAQQVDLAMAQSSVFGLNRAYITTDGTPSSSMIERRLKEVNVSSEVREAKIGRFFNSIMAGGFYDNSTALLVVLLIKKAKALFYEKNTRHPHTFKINVTRVRSIMNNGPDGAFEALHKYLSLAKDGFGFSQEDEEAYLLLEEIEDWYKKQLKTGAKLHEALLTDIIDDTTNFEREVQVWMMHTYDDGHSKSGKSFGSHIGFVNNRYLATKALTQTNGGNSPRLKKTKYGVPATDAAIDAYMDVKGHVNLSGFTTLECTILNDALNGNVRMSPFLIDQDIAFEYGDHSINAYHMGDEYYNRRTLYTSRDVDNTIFKYTTNHRVQEDLLCAQRILRYWYAQPGAETVEAHWWSGLHRTMCLPQLGLVRASFPFLLEGEAVSLTCDAIENYKNSRHTVEDDCLQSLWFNTFWYWGEFMNIHNKLNTYDLLSAVANTRDDDLEGTTRAHAITSAMMGQAIDTPQYSQVGTYLTHGLGNLKHTIVRFGHVNIKHVGDSGYTVDEGGVKFNTVVAPGGLSLIIGTNSSLNVNTPYAGVFQLGSAVQIRERLHRYKGYNFNDLWALGVVNRWNGYDTYYNHPVTDNSHKMYAANGVSIAMPPVLAQAAKFVTSYRVTSTEEREHVFGSDFSDLGKYKLRFMWTRYDTYATVEPEYRAARCVESQNTNYTPCSFRLTPTNIEYYTAFIKAEYDISHSDFHIERLTPGVAMPAKVGVLELPPDVTVQPGEDQVEEAPT